MAEIFRATAAIFLGRARVANPGDVIPPSHPKFKEWKDADLVASDGTKAAEEAAGVFDPSMHTVDEVNTHLSTADDAERDRVLAAERSGKNRATVDGIAG